MIVKCRVPFPPRLLTFGKAVLPTLLILLIFKIDKKSVKSTFFFFYIFRNLFFLCYHPSVGHLE